jgi:hypothetical protein
LIWDDDIALHLVPIPTNLRKWPLGQEHVSLVVTRSTGHPPGLTMGIVSAAPCPFGACPVPLSVCLSVGLSVPMLRQCWRAASAMAVINGQARAQGAGPRRQHLRVRVVRVACQGSPRSHLVAPHCSARHARVLHALARKMRAWMPQPCHCLTVCSASQQCGASPHCNAKEAIPQRVAAVHCHRVLLARQHELDSTKRQVQ